MILGGSLDATTVVGSDPGGTALEATASVHALVIAWYPDDPLRVGELAVVPDDGPGLTLGRGAGRRAGPRIRFFRQRPGIFQPTGHLAASSLSRDLLLVEPGDGKLVLRRIGRAAMRVNGRPCDEATLEHGDVVRVGAELVLLYVRRGAVIPPLRFFPRNAMPTFGQADVTGILGESPAVWQLRESVAFAARAGVHVLILGESGTGKELAARAIHRLSARSDRAFVARNAATMPAGLLDAELFGHVRNYPNMGMPERSGLVGEANGGILFLDEIGELSEDLQAHLLRVLDASGEYQRLGEASTRRSDFVLVGATNRGRGVLKMDLGARLVSQVEVPSLAARLEDIPLLARHIVLRAARRNPELAARFVQSRPDGAAIARMGAEFVEHLLRRDYSVHTREIEALVWRSIEKSPGDTLELHDLPREASPAAPRRGKRRRSEPSPSEIRDALAAASGNVERAAAALRLSSRFALYRLMKKHGIKSDPG